MKTAPWVEGNSVRLLENGEAYFPRVFDAIRTARREVLIETFILFEDEVGMELHAALIDAATRGVSIDITVDGWGSCDLSEPFITALNGAGVRLHRFDHHPRIFGIRPHLFRRMHRKMVLIDQRIGFIGGINYAFNHLRRSGPDSKQDYAAEVQGPIVDEMYRFMQSALGRPLPLWRRILRRAQRHKPPPAAVRPRAGKARALLVTRDNNRHRNDIERHYCAAIRSAQQRVIIANAYFLPGFHLLRQLAGAARRGVAVDLVLQGKPDMAIAVWGSTALYAYLMRAGVRVHEYCERPLHGKIAIMDEEWATVGSSNLDPFSLSLNLEANLVVLDADFNREVGDHLLDVIQTRCRRVPDSRARFTLLRGLLSIALFHLLRWFPRYLAALPAHEPRVEQASLQDVATQAIRAGSSTPEIQARSR